MMLRRILMMAATVMFIAGCQNKVKTAEQAPGGWDVTIRGKVGFPKKGKIEISELRASSSVNPFTDSIQLDMENYTFEKTMHLYQPGYYQINFYNIQTVDFILHDTDIEVNVDGNDPTGFSEVKGSPDHDLIAEVQTFVRTAMSSPEITKLEAEFQQVAEAGNSKRVAELQEEYGALTRKTHDSVVALLSSQPPSIGMMNILQGNLLDKDVYFAFYKEVAGKLDSQWPNSQLVKDFSDMVQRMAVTAIGAQAPEISLPDQNGNIVTLSSMKGRYVLVDFWAKWCGPCRRENPNVVKAYQKFKGERFEILGVSLDRNREDWLRAIEEDELTWTQVSDLKYFDSQAALDYNINAIPFSILVDPSGVIIAKNLRGSGLDKKLSEIFKKS
jgi:peroxiredoxin